MEPILLQLRRTPRVLIKEPYKEVLYIIVKGFKYEACDRTLFGSIWKLEPFFMRVSDPSVTRPARVHLGVLLCGCFTNIFSRITDYLKKTNGIPLGFYINYIFVFVIPLPFINVFSCFCKTLHN